MDRNQPKIIHDFKKYRFTFYLSYDEAFYSVRIIKNEDNESIFFGTAIQLAALMNGEKLEGFYSGNYTLEELNENQLILFKSSPVIQDLLNVLEQYREKYNIQILHDYYDSLTEYDTH